MRFSQPFFGPGPRVRRGIVYSASFAPASLLPGILVPHSRGLRPIELAAIGLGQRDLVSGETSRSPAVDATIRANCLREISVTPQFPKPSGRGYLGNPAGHAKQRYAA